MRWLAGSYRVKWFIESIIHLNTASLNNNEPRPIHALKQLCIEVNDITISHIIEVIFNITNRLF